MRNIIYIFISISIFGCRPNAKPIQEVNKSGDTIKKMLVKELIVAREKLVEAAKKDSTKTVEFNALLAKYDIVLAKLNDGQFDALDLIRVSNEIESLKSEDNELRTKLTTAERRNELLQIGKDFETKKLESEKLLNKKITYEKNVAEAKIENASKLEICCEAVKAYTFKRRLNYRNRDSIADRLETDKAAKVKQVVISFKIPKNKLFTQKWYEIIAIIKGSDVVPDGVKEKIGFDYNGDYQEHDISFNKSIDWRASNHTVLLTNGKDTLYRGNLKLK